MKGPLPFSRTFLGALGALLVLALGNAALAQSTTTISALPSATTPLAGTELVPVVQGGVTKKAPASAFGGGGGGGTPANPTATAGDTAVNGSATTYMRSDAAPAVQKATSGQFGIVKVDGTTITAAGGVITATTGGSGNVTGTGSSVPGNLPQLNNTTTTAIVDSGVAASSVVTLTGSQTLTNKTISGGNNTLSAIGTSSLATTQGNGAKVQLSSGATTTNDCVKFDGSGNTVDAGAGCGTTPVTTVASSGASQSLAFPASGNSAYDITLTANCTLTITGGTAGQLQTVTLILRQSGGGGFTPTLPAGTKWPGGTTPAVNTVAGRIDVFTFITPDAGTTVLGNY